MLGAVLFQPGKTQGVIADIARLYSRCAGSSVLFR